MFSDNWHTDRDTSDIVPASGLAATTRALAKIISEVNGLNLEDLRASRRHGVLSARARGVRMLRAVDELGREAP
jgi:hypothetical protein